MNKTSLKTYLKTIFGEEYKIGDNAFSKILFYIHNKRPSRLAKFGHLEAIKYEFGKDYRFPSVCINYALENDDLEMTKYFYNIHHLVPSKHSISKAFRNESYTTLNWLFETNKELTSDSWIYVYAIEKGVFEGDAIIKYMMVKGVEPDVHSIFKAIEKGDTKTFTWFLKKYPIMCCDDVVVYMVWKNETFKTIFIKHMF